MGKCQPLGSLNSFLSYAPQLSGAKFSSLFILRSGRWLLLVFPQLLSNHLVGLVASAGSRALCSILGSPHSPLDVRKHWCFLPTGMAGSIFISHMSFRWGHHGQAALATLSTNDHTQVCTETHTHSHKKTHSQKSTSNS